MHAMQTAKKDFLKGLIYGLTNEKPKFKDYFSSNDKSYKTT